MNRVTKQAIGNRSQKLLGVADSAQIVELAIDRNLAQPNLRTENPQQGGVPRALD